MTVVVAVLTFLSKNYCRFCTLRLVSLCNISLCHPFSKYE